MRCAHTWCKTPSSVCDSSPYLSFKIFEITRFLSKLASSRDSGKALRWARWCPLTSSDRESGASPQKCWLRKKRMVPKVTTQHARLRRTRSAMGWLVKYYPYDPVLLTPHATCRMKQWEYFTAVTRRIPATLSRFSQCRMPLQPVCHRWFSHNP